MITFSSKKASLSLNLHKQTKKLRIIPQNVLNIEAIDIQTIEYLKLKFKCALSCCFDFRNENNGIFVLGWVFFLQTNFDFLTSHF